MNFYKSNYQTLRRSSPAKMGRRFIACVIDMILVFLVAAAIFAGTYAIAKTTASYKETASVIEAETDYFEDILMPDTHLLEFVDGVQAHDEVVAYINLLKAVKTSFEKNGKDFSPFYEKINAEDLEDLIAKLSESDDITHFYTVYIPAKISEGLTFTDSSGKKLEYKSDSSMTYLKSIYV